MNDDVATWPRAKEELLAALDLPREERAARLARLSSDDAELGREVAALVALAADDEMGFLAFLETPALERAAGALGVSAAAPERVGPWRLELEIGRGGMGSVWRARRDDGAFEQTVAIKLVRPELASDLLRRRLVAETRILAGLEHESIARLVDGGTTPEGVPYLALEFVIGEPIDAWCDRRALPVKERLALFCTVCAAVEFAHRKLVLHRDLKSGNVLVDEAGRPKLLDFGIAKLLAPSGDTEDWTALGFERPLTPEWASPEQLRGETLTTASDVYSLGVLLHVLLTGRRPHRWTGQAPEAFAREIEESGGGPPIGASRVAVAPGVDPKRLRGDLQRIAVRALAPEVERRYGTVAELAGDVERYLAGRPISAHPPTAGYRLGKFLRRHRTASIAGAVAAASLLVATAVSLGQARIAERERARAERRFGDVRQLANKFLFEFEEMIRDLPGSTPARERVAATARDYLDRLAAEAGDDTALLDELTQAYLKVGDLEGHPQLANLGRPAEARASYVRARDLALRSISLEQGSLAARKSAATADVRLGDLELESGDVDEAERRFTVALDTTDGALALAPGNLDARRLLGQLLQRLGSVHLARGDYPEAVALFERYRDSAAKLQDEGPQEPEAKRDLLVASIYLGDGYDEWGRPGEALASFERALQLSNELRAAQPGAQSGRDWSVALQRVLIALRKLGRHGEALGHARTALEWTEQAAAADPRNRLLRRDLAESVVDVGRELLAVERASEALDFLSRGRGLFEELAKAEPESEVVRRYEASALFFEAEALGATGRQAEGERAARRAAELGLALLAKQADDAELRQELSACFRLLARFELARGAAHAAQTSLARAAEVERQPSDVSKGGEPESGAGS